MQLPKQDLAKIKNNEKIEEVVLNFINNNTVGDEHLTKICTTGHCPDPKHKPKYSYKKHAITDNFIVFTFDVSFDEFVFGNACCSITPRSICYGEIELKLNISTGMSDWL
jgi:hypothetical protein